MTTRTPLDLRGKTMTELMADDSRISAEIAEKNRLAGYTCGILFPIHPDYERIRELLVDSQKIREEMERRQP